MHILLLSYFYDTGYPTLDALLERYESTTGWAESLLAAEAGQVTVLQRYHHDAELARNGVRYLFRADGRRPRPRPWASMRRIHRVAAGLRPDIAHVQGLLFPWQVRLLRRALPRGSAIVAQDHSGVFFERGNPTSLSARLRRAWYRAGLVAADGFLFSVREQAESWRAAGAIAASQPVYEVLESSRRLRPMPRAHARAASGLHGNPAVLWVGRLNANKDPLTVLAGFERALPLLPQARLAMTYLTDDMLPEVRARLAASPALAERVDLLGCLPYDRMAALLSAADLFVLGSHRESSGYALIEAIACGAVPVVTDIPSFRAITAGGRLGRLWPPGDARALSEALVALGRADLGPVRAAMAEHFERELSWGAVGRSALAIYREVLERR
jgi:glycosyltransferase involved in cell wall biosynthesis